LRVAPGSETLAGFKGDAALNAHALPRSGFVQCPLCRYRHNGHATGHRSRLNRDQSGSYGTKKYAFEELVAELAAAFGCASLGIVPTVRHSDYIGSWLEVLREDNRAIVRAASQASKAADYLLGFVPDIAPASAPDTLVRDHEVA
jgi:antirestriction protein ArdC